MVPGLKRLNQNWNGVRIESDQILYHAVAFGRIRQLNDLKYSQQIVAEGRKRSGPLAWFLGQVVVETRDFIIYGLLRRPRHPKNVFS